MDQPSILIVDDSKADVALLKRHLTRKTVATLRVARDGAEAVAMLNDASIPLPTFILLDLNMPTKDGREVLAEMKLNERLRVIPVIVMTTSKAQNDVDKAFKLGANAYITKPIDKSAYESVVSAVVDFWVKTCLFHT